MKKVIFSIMFLFMALCVYPAQTKVLTVTCPEYTFYQWYSGTFVNNNINAVGLWIFQSTVAGSGEYYAEIYVNDELVFDGSFSKIDPISFSVSGCGAGTVITISIMSEGPTYDDNEPVNFGKIDCYKYVGPTP